MTSLRCNVCSTPLEQVAVDLGMSPLVSSYVRPDETQQSERFYPLRVFVCHSCLLVQLPPVQTPEELFSDYPYFSSYSSSWLRHAKGYVDRMMARFRYRSDSQVVEIASNDGYLLQYFKELNVPVLGVEPAANVAKVAQASGIPTTIAFFGVETARRIAQNQGLADLIVGNNVLAHVPDLNDFVGGLKLLLKPGGVITMEFPHVLRLIEGNQFDTIFHEHFSYLSLLTVEALFLKHQLAIFDCEELSTHGGSLRIFGCHNENGSHPVLPSVSRVLAEETRGGLDDAASYRSLGEKARLVKQHLLSFLIQAKAEGRSIVGYGAPGKGSVLLNYCGIRTDFLDYTVDRSPHKQGLLMPGVHVPIEHPDRIRETRPDYVLILPWNLRDEIVEQMNFITDWGGRFIVPIPTVSVIP